MKRIKKNLLKSMGIAVLCAVFLVGQLQGTVFGLSTEQKSLFEAGVRYYDLNFCDDSAIDGGPLYSPRFPRTENTADLVDRIRNFIQNSRPRSVLDEHAELFVQTGQRLDVNPALVVAMALKETELGTTGVGRPPPDGGYNISGMRPGGDFAVYSGYPASIRATFENLAGSLYLGPPSNFTTIAQIIRRWAPSFENNTVSYIQFVRDNMRHILEGTVPSDGSDPVSTCNTGTVESGAVNAQGYSFPVGPQRKSQNSGVPAMSPLPCGSPTSCHHPFYPPGSYAFDISRRPGGNVTTGTPIYALSNGRIDMLHTYNGISGCFSLQFNSSIDNTWYWYGHIQNPTVRNQQRVQAGQQIAEIGTSACASGSSPHLHIDRGCIIGGVPQKGGRAECRDRSFVSFMNNLFNSLPE